jgi:predicted extracellular nuclease
LPRRGTRLAALRGVVRLESGTPRLLVPALPVWAAAAPPAPVRARPGALRVVALNLHNYFISPLGLGARSELELQRQRTKLAAALLALDADVLALTELENDGSRSLEHLLEGLAGEAPDHPAYTFAEEAPPSGSQLRVAIAYRPARVWPNGPAWFETRSGFRRAPLFQSFDAARGSLTIGVVHFKSKHCGDEPMLVPEEGCGDDTRRAEAELLLESLQGQRTRRPLEPLLVVGDLNSDPLEAAVVTLEQGGLVDLLGALPQDERYSFVYEGRASLIDHALGSSELAARARGAGIWHINADEPAFRDYSLDNPPDAYVADARRSSDHDPIIVDLDF